MAAPDVFNADVIYNGTVSFGQTPNFPAGAVTNTAIASLAAIDASKLNCHRAVTYQFAAPTVEPAASTYIVIHTANAAGGLIGIKATITGTLSGAGDPVGVNLYRSTAGSTFATVLSSTISMGSTNTLLVPASGTISNSTMAASDLLALKCTLAGTSTIARGLAVTVTYYEKYS